MPDFENSIGRNIKKFRLAAGLTQKELAERCELATGTIQQYELGKREPRIEQQKLICDKLEIPPVALITGTTDNLANHAFIDGMNDLMEALEIADGNIELAKQIAQLKIEMLTDYASLNISGQKKAAEQIKLLTKIPEYKK